MNFIISKMNNENATAVAEIEKNCFSKPWSISAIEAELENPNAHFYVLTVEDNNAADNKIVGYGGMHIILDEAYIANIAVLPQFRKNGFGKAITTQLINNAINHSCEFISLEVRPSNTNAVKMYSLLGFEEVGKRKNFYSSPTEDGLIMTKYLNTKD
ncbi:MAG: ribosomal protein S18-alanine N-acetyltransferase [Acutalibacteraceae bacterium]|nr:ribosomal protein S18-alanine N-acetyltransferase [Acutalibacteraceae bacterium]